MYGIFPPEAGIAGEDTPVAGTKWNAGTAPNANLWIKMLNRLE